MTMLMLAALPIAALVIAAALPQQVTATFSAGQPAFEVASVKANTSGERPGGVQFLPGGRLSAVNMPLRSLIHFAYQVRPFQIEGVPDWAATAHYDVAAKAATEFALTPSGLPPVGAQMLQRLLAERFMLRTHTEMRNMPIYALILARPDGKLGPALTASTTECTPFTPSATARGGLPAPGRGDRLQCGLMIGPQRINAGAIELSELARELVGIVHRHVVDRTGLTGRYDVQATFQAEPLIGPGGLLIPPQQDAAATGQPSLFTAMQEQLGLKLEATRGQAPVLVVDRLDRPAGD